MANVGLGVDVGTGGGHFSILAMAVEECEAIADSHRHIHDSYHIFPIRTVFFGSTEGQMAAIYSVAVSSDFI